MIVDDHPIWRDTLRSLLEQDGATRVVAEAGDGPAALEHAREGSLDVVVMDINLPTMDGIEVTRRALACAPGIRVLMLASSDEPSLVMDAVRAGASGYLVKTAAARDVVEAVQRIHAGELVFPPALADVVLGELRRTAEAPTPARPRVAVAVPALLERKGLGEVLQEAGLEVVASVATLDDLGDDGVVDVTIVDADLLQDSRPSVASLAGSNVLVLTREADVADAVRLLSATGRGVGYLLKGRIGDPDQLIDAIMRVHRGDSVVDAKVVDGLVELPENVRSLDTLTAREREVLGMMAQGHSNQAIAERMFLGLKTVEAHVRSIFSKLGLEPDGDVHRRVLAVMAYLRST